MSRTIAIGDIHGCCEALTTLLSAIEPSAGDLIVTLGDYVDRGPDSRGVIEQLLSLERQCRLIALLGNHELMMLASRADPAQCPLWLCYGGQATLDSYGSGAELADVPPAHWRFLERCEPYAQTEQFMFTHAAYDPQQPLHKQPDEWLFWRSLRDGVPAAHCSGKIAIVGHTPQSSGLPLDLGHLLCLDTGCVYGGRLTAMDLGARTVWQADAKGVLVQQPNSAQH